MRCQIARLAAALITVFALASLSIAIKGHAGAQAVGQRPPQQREIARSMCRAVRESPTELVVRVAVPKGQFSQNVQTGSIAIRGEDFVQAPGTPDLPVLRRLIAIPRCVSIKIKAKAEKRSVATNVRFSSRGGLGDAPLDLAASRSWASKPIANAFPGHMARVRVAGHLRGQRLALLEIFPVQYDASRRELVTYESIDITLTFDTPYSDTHANVGPMERVLKTCVLNSAPSAAVDAGPRRQIIPASEGSVCWIADSTFAEGAASVASCGADYLIIVADVLSHGADSALVDSLAQWRAAYNRFNVAIVRTGTIMSCDTCAADTAQTPVDIRDFIKAVYDDSSAAHMGDGRLGYVLLIGDTFDPERHVLIPMYYGFGDVNQFTCDGYYALLSNDDPAADLFPDVFLGRLPVDADTSQWELRNVVRRILNYEPLTEGAPWLDKVLLVSGGSDNGYTFEGQGLAGFQALFDSTRSWYIPPSKTTTQMHFLDPTYSGGGVFSQAWCDSLRSGYGICAIFDHGNFFYVAGTSGNYATLPMHYDVLDTDYPPLVFTLCSYLGTCDYTVDKVGSSLWGGGSGPCVPSLHGTCPSLVQTDARIDSADVFAERLLVQERGAIGVIATNRSMGTIAAEKALPAFFEGLYEQKAVTLGEALVIPKMLGRVESVHWRWGLALFGDPAVNVQWTDVEHDAVDLAVRASDIPDQDVAASSGQLSITVRNEGPASATNVGVEVWLGHPDSSGSSLVGSGSIASIAAYDTVGTQVPVNLSPGRRHVFVYLNPDSSISEPTRANNIAGGYCHAIPNITGFPVQLQESAHHSVVLRDVDGVPGSEILFATPTRIHCYGKNGTRRWSFGRSTPSSRSAPAVANMYKDGHQYIVCELGGNVYLLNAVTGIALDSVSVGGASSSYDLGCAIGDLRADDDQLEFVIRVDSSFQARAFGDSLWEVTPATGFSYGGLAICDLDGDGSNEVVIASAGVLEAFDAASGGIEWGPKSLGGPAVGARVLAVDGDQDGNMEILVSEVRGTLHEVALYDHQGNRKWGYGVASGGGNAPSFVVGDLQLSATPTLVIASQNVIRSLTWDAMSVTLVDSTMVDTPFLQDIWLADVLGDARPEVITLALRTVASRPFDDKHDAVVAVFDANLTLVDSTLVFAKSPICRPGIGDVDGDDIPEVCVLTPDNLLHAVSVSDRVGAVQWGMYDGDAMHTNVYMQPLGGTYDVPVSLFNRVNVLGDVEFLAPIYVDATAEILVSDEDALASGEDTLRTEIRANAEFRAVGSDEQAVRFVGWDGSTETNDPDAWWGILISDSLGGASGEFVNCEIRDAAWGLQADGANLTLTNSMIANCEIGVAVYDDSRLDATGTAIIGNTYGAVLSKGAGSWLGGTLRSCSFTNNSGGGIWIAGTGDSTVVVEGCTIEDNSSFGVYAQETKIVVNGTTIRDGEFGISATMLTSLELSNATIEDASLFGVTVRDSWLDATETLFDGNDIGLDLNAQCGDPGPPCAYFWVKATIRGCTFSNNGDGVWIDSVYDSLVVVDDCVFDENTTSGIYVESGSNVTITRNAITNSTTGIYCYSGGPVIRSGNVIQYCTGGIKCDDSSYAVVESCTVTSNTNGVVAINNANPDLGHVSGGSSVGCNNLSGNTAYHVTNFTGNTLKAENEYWAGVAPNCYPKASKIYGSVDYIPSLCSAPALMAMAYLTPTEETRIPKFFELGENYPNPFNPMTTARYEVPLPGAFVEISVFDVAGRLVNTLVRRDRAPGYYSVVWDGHDRRGRPVASGVYFLRMKAGQFVKTRKIVMLK